MENAAENVRKFAEDEKIDVVFMMGMAPKAESIERFLGVINIKNSSLFTAILNAINEMKDPNLQLTPKDVDFMSGLFYMQENIKASRKQILPVIKNLLNRF
ncbi:CLUMA_CG011715, isoform A [Clunio marinus]|uniref:CLUMA_CG011715, isoform A n=1 Tax=Clunio marinus TaxID=568069 RepID=A0A1J1IDR0_9DIPT|nr:CLUMA_CG011715, isoform A [Clunio marinus]